MQATTIGSNLTIVTVNGGDSGTRTPVENWELDCEICHRKHHFSDNAVYALDNKYHV